MEIVLEIVLGVDKSGDRPGFGCGVSVSLDLPRFGKGYDESTANLKIESNVEQCRGHKNVIL